MDQHFDAERLAAFMDGTLSHEERAAAEAHAADCPRCLHLLAAMSRIEDLPPAPRRFWSRSFVRWSVPLLAGATALALWINVRRESATLVPVATAPDSMTAAAPMPAAPPEERKNEVAQRAETAKPKIRGQADRKTRADRQSARDAFERSKETAAAVETAPAAAPLVDELRKAPPQSSPAPSAPGARLRAGEVAESVDIAGNAAAGFEVVSPDGAARWRLVGKTIVYSSDAGKTWSSRPLPPQAELSAGSSASARVAWFVGRNGYIVVTTGTNEWRPVSFPEAVDLTNVTARSEQAAEVMTADGRVFATTDGGQTWRRR